LRQFFGVIIGEDDNFNARIKQGRDDVALQEVDDCHAVIGGDEDTFGHVCPNCGESYLTAETLHEIERIKMHRKNLAKKRSIAVAEFVEA
jgi:predicted RNA-binding Zn-ribbon protein involved in translation (DUF1610 family)